MAKYLFINLTWFMVFKKNQRNIIQLNKISCSQLPPDRKSTNNASSWWSYHKFHGFIVLWSINFKNGIPGITVINSSFLELELVLMLLNFFFLEFVLILFEFHTNFSIHRHQSGLQNRGGNRSSYLK